MTEKKERKIEDVLVDRDSSEIEIKLITKALEEKHKFLNQYAEKHPEKIENISLQASNFLLHDLMVFVAAAGKCKLKKPYNLMLSLVTLGLRDADEFYKVFEYTSERLQIVAMTLMVEEHGGFPKNLDEKAKKFLDKIKKEKETKDE
jgi:hypothetical protein